MIGGTVIETITLEDRVWINCRDDKSEDECAICVELTAQARCVSERDRLWWQGNQAFWTAKERIGGRTIGKAEIPLKRIGFSGVKRPVVVPETVESGVAPTALS